jgi:hypothetical protein
MGIKTIVELNSRHFSHVGTPNLAEFSANFSVFHPGKMPDGILLEIKKNK